jgi:hypothetical protein
LRMAGDVIDKKSLPPDAGARTAAETRMSDLPSYAKGMGYDIFSGGVGALSGGLWAKARTPSPGVDLSALRNHAAGIDRGGFPEMLRGQRMSQDELAAVLADRSTKAVRAQQSLNAARQGARPACLQVAAMYLRRYPAPAHQINQSLQWKAS